MGFRFLIFFWFSTEPWYHSFIRTVYCFWFTDLIKIIYTSLNDKGNLSTHVTESFRDIWSGMVWSGCWLWFFFFFCELSGWFYNVSTWLSWTAFSRIPFPVMFLIWVDHKRRHRARCRRQKWGSCNFCFLYSEAQSIEAGTCIEECIRQTISQLPDLSLILKLCQGG